MDTTGIKKKISPKDLENIKKGGNKTFCPIINEEENESLLLIKLIRKQLNFNDPINEFIEIMNNNLSNTNKFLLCDPLPYENPSLIPNALINIIYSYRKGNKIISQQNIIQKLSNQQS